LEATLALMVRSRCGTLAVALMATTLAVGCQSTGVPSSRYPAPYGRPKVEEITTVLAKVRDRAESRVNLRITDPVTKKLVSDPPGAAPSAAAWGPFNPTGYPAALLYAGLLSAGDATGDPAYADWVARRFQFLAYYVPRMKDVQGPRIIVPLRNLVTLQSLDSCGAMGTAMIKAERAGLNVKLDALINRFAQFVRKKQFRLADGTLARNRPVKNSIWADDMYMSVPLLAQMGALTGEAAYFDDASRQVLQISARLFVPSTGLYTHAWNAQTADDQPHYYWGRANGWCVMATVELLDVMPRDHPQRPAVLKLLRAHVQGLASVQSGAGLWHQMLDRTDSPLETSASAMFTYAMARAVNRGWISAATYGPVAIAGWNGITTRIDSAGRVTGTCVGTDYAADYMYYDNRPMVDDQHGYGPVLFAGAEIIRMLKNPRFKIATIKSGPLMVLEKTSRSATQPQTQPQTQPDAEPAASN
jgi:unsaturated rhamnogalacturonyl hydrolase